MKFSDYFIRKGEFDEARKVLEEAIEEIDNAKDFGVIFSAYVKFEEEMIKALADENIQSYYEVVGVLGVFELTKKLSKLIIVVVILGGLWVLYNSGTFDSLIG